MALKHVKVEFPKWVLISKIKGPGIQGSQEIVDNLRIVCLRFLRESRHIEITGLLAIPVCSHITLKNSYLSQSDENSYDYHTDIVSLSDQYRCH